MNEVFFSIIGTVGLAVLAGLYVHLKKRAVFSRALATEISGLLAEAGELKLYLSQEGHDWLKPGQILREAPVHLRMKTPVFHFGMRELHRLSGNAVRKVLAFYAAFENIQRLMEILFARIMQQVQSREPLSDKSVQMTKIRIRRILQGLDLMAKIGTVKVKGLGQLPDSYELPTAQSFAPDTGGVISQNKN